ncbi:hypothetical protein CPB83DRAFT_899892 [Crepidotus variabilis]|uniref:DUF6532 domain-containing protein n=1 Tax=Crepidotus variabilis TaxID=179855 RepID=A0A9P6E433_9AGAR|nr:hypothetical protein CPB83DRAFT_899892 [Crepidotus variabilis]
MAPTTQRGKKAAETRLENIERERRDNEHLVREMEAQGPRKAKNKAMEVAVWKRTVTKRATVSKKSRKGEEESDEEHVDDDRRQRTKHVGKRVVDGNVDGDNNGDNEGGDDEGAGEDEEEEEKKVKHKKKVQQKPLNSRNHNTGSDSDSDSDTEKEKEKEKEEDKSSDTSSDDEGVADFRAETTYIVKNTGNNDGLSELDEEPAAMAFDKDIERDICGTASPQPSPQPSRRAESPQLSPQLSPRPSPTFLHARKRAHVLDSSDEENIPPAAAKRTKSTNSRKDNFLAERPKITASKPRKEGKKTPHSNSKSSQSTPTQWSADVQIKPAVVRSDKKRKLTEQTFIIQAIVCHAIEKATAEILLRNNWPEENNRNLFGQTLLLNACQDADIKNTYEVIGEVKKCIRADALFTKAVCDLVVDQFSGLRMPAKTEAAKQLPFYNLGLGETCKQCVASLFKDLRFHMNGTWGGDSGHEWQHDTKSAFTSCALINTIKEAYFSNPRAVGFRYIDQFSSSVPDKSDEKEMPISLIALCLTGLYCCLSEFEDGKKKELAFDATRFLPINRSFMNIFKKLHKERPLQAHARFHEILNLVIGDSSAGSTEEIENNAYNVIDF